MLSLVVCKVTARLYDSLLFQDVWVHKILTTVLNTNNVSITLTLPALYIGVLQPLACWDLGFESRRGHGCLSPLMCCQVEVSASG
jgi:hypothetical protein